MKVCIIGSGIGGLYTAFLLKKKGIDFTVYEQHETIGGRIKMVEFDDGMKVIGGAGIGRKSDVLLYRLCENLKIKVNPYKAQPSYTDDIKMDFTPIEKIQELKSIHLTKQERATLTFKDFAIKHLGQEEYNKLILYIGETDFERADVVDVLYDYGFEKSFSSGFEAFGIDWDNFLEAFKIELQGHIQVGKKIEGINQTNNGTFLIDNTEYDKVVIATEISSVRDLIPSSSKIYDDVACQTFARVYAKLDMPLNLKGKRAIITQNPFQKIIEWSAKDNVYMISYSDNEVADYWKRNENNMTEIIENNIEKIFKQKVKVLKVKLIYWNCGTHYFKPLDTTLYKTRDDFLKKAQHPMKNVYVVGEAFSKNQGWCEGALESVEKIICELDVNKKDGRNRSQRRSIIHFGAKRFAKPKISISKKSRYNFRQLKSRAQSQKRKKKTIILKTSPKADKKYMVVVDDKTIHFGAKGYSDFTQHKTPERKKRYISRHAKNENWTKSGIKTAGFWSANLLWNKPTLSESIANIEKKFGVDIKYVT
jgi:hypothetical protein